MADETISRADVRHLIVETDRIGGISRRAFKTLYNRIDELAPVTPQPKIGYWICHHEPYTWMGWATWSCSECDFYIQNGSAKTKFCPNCGAKMVGIRDEKEVINAGDN